jgi:hypothetical protein
MGFPSAAFRRDSRRVILSFHTVRMGRESKVWRGDSLTRAM